MKILLKAGADVSVKDIYDRTALFLRGLKSKPVNKRGVKVALRANILINEDTWEEINALGYILGCSDDRDFDESRDEEVATLLYAAGETLEDVPETNIPDCLQFEDVKLQLKHICRETIRKHLLDLDPHHHLFERIPQRGLPDLMNQYLLYGESLDDDDDDDDVDDDD